MIDIQWRDDVLAICKDCGKKLVGCYELGFGRSLTFISFDPCLECVDELKTACEAALEA